MPLPKLHSLVDWTLSSLARNHEGRDQLHEYLYAGQFNAQVMHQVCTVLSPHYNVDQMALWVENEDFKELTQQEVNAICTEYHTQITYAGVLVQQADECHFKAQKIDFKEWQARNNAHFEEQRKCLNKHTELQFAAKLLWADANCRRYSAIDWGQCSTAIDWTSPDLERRLNLRDPAFFTAAGTLNGNYMWIYHWNTDLGIPTEDQ